MGAKDLKPTILEGQLGVKPPNQPYLSLDPFFCKIV